MTSSEATHALFSLFRTAESLSEVVYHSRPYKLALDLLASCARRVTFVQVGANDGSSGDPLRPCIVDSDWTGLLIEPHPEAFSALQRLYEGAGNRIKLVNKAITQHQAMVDLLEPDTRFGSRTATIVPNSGWARNCPIKRRFQVDGIPLSALLREHEMQRVDVLQIDVEGYDFEAMTTLDFSVTRPSLISYEDRHFFPPKKRTEAVNFLRAKGYKVLTGLPPDDTLAIDEEAFHRLVRP